MKRIAVLAPAAIAIVGLALFQHRRRERQSDVVVVQQPGGSQYVKP